MLSMRGHVDYEFSRGGILVRKGGGPNLITNVGEQFNANLWDPRLSIAKVDWAGLGSGTNPPSSSSQALTAEFGTRQQSQTTGTAVNLPNIFYTFQWTLAEFNVVAEVGLFNAITVGTMVSRFLVQEFEAQSGDILNLQWTLQFGGLT